MLIDELKHHNTGDTICTQPALVKNFFQFWIFSFWSKICLTTKSDFWPLMSKIFFFQNLKIFVTLVKDLEKSIKIRQILVKEFVMNLRPKWQKFFHWNFWPKWQKFWKSKFFEFLIIEFCTMSNKIFKIPSEFFFHRECKTQTLDLWWYKTLNFTIRPRSFFLI